MFTDKPDTPGEELLLRRRKALSAMSAEERAAANDYARGYLSFLNAAKTEREAVREGVALAERAGFRPYALGDPIERGGAYYLNNRGKSLYLFRVGEESLERGVRISASHIDSPRLDLKPNPLYEDSGIAYLRTHYYGGIKKYQWVATPLALHGVISRADGEIVSVSVGEDEGDPVFYISDLLPHLAKDQSAKSMSSGIPGEKLCAIVGIDGGEGEDVKMQVLRLLHEKYGITEEDFLTAELSLVPATKAREVGFDRALLGGYGHDDRVCSYPALTAILEAKDSPHTVLAILADKEEVGSGGPTGMRSALFTDLLEELSLATGANPRRVKAASRCLSADVNAAYDPNFADVYEKRNSCEIGGGVVLTKYTGSGGKSGSNDASAEYIGQIRRIFAREGIVWQTGELGKVDAGGGGTVAVYIATQNIDTVDLGVPVLSMHSPYELISKADLYETHRAFLAFNRA